MYNCLLSHAHKVLTRPVLSEPPLGYRFHTQYQSSIELKRKLDGKSIANFVNKNTIFPHKIIIVHLPDLSFLCYIYLLSNLPPLYVVTCLFLLPHVNYALNYTIPLYMQKYDTYFWFRTDRLLAAMGTRNNR